MIFLCVYVFEIPIEAPLIYFRVSNSLILYGFQCRMMKNGEDIFSSTAQAPMYYCLNLWVWRYKSLSRYIHVLESLHRKVGRLKMHLYADYA